MKCNICGKPQEDDLFSFVTQSPVCSICTLKFIGGLPATSARIQAVRDELGLKDGEYLVQDSGKEAARILGRYY